MKCALIVTAAMALAATAAMADPASPDQAGATKVVWVARQGPPAVFIDRTSGGNVGMAFGVVGAIAVAASAQNAGHQAALEDQIEDPGGALAEKIARAYAGQVGGALAAAPISTPAMVRPDKKAYAEAAPDARYVVEVSTRLMGTFWASYASWPLDLSHYVVGYAARAWIEDMQTGKPVFEASCQVYTKRRPGLPTHEEMYANGGAILKTMIAETADQCLNSMRLPGPATPS